MQRMRREDAAALGFTVKSGWACAVLVSGASSPRVEDTCRVELSDPEVPDSRQPYHDGFASERARGKELAALLSSIKRYGRRSVTGLIERYETAGHALHGAGIVVGSLIDPERITNPHIRIHAREGQLFRGVVTDAAERRRIASTIFRERDLYPSAQTVLKQSDDQIRVALAAMGREVEGSWRAEHKAAALAAWLVLRGAVVRSS